MVIDYISNLGHALELCDKFEESVEYVFFNKGKAKETSIPNFCWSDPYRNYFSPVKACVQLCRLIGLQSLASHESFFYKEASSLEDPKKVQNLEDFKSHVKSIRLGFQIAEQEMLAFISSFDEEERERMNEAIHVSREGCNYSSVAMSVSAAESRLLKLMCLASPDSTQELEKKTLGQLIYEYANNKDKYKNVVPEKHKPLLQLCNTYRTFSVHPKKQNITSRLATSILNLAIEFLTDQDTKPEVVKAQLIASEEGK